MPSSNNYIFGNCAINTKICTGCPKKWKLFHALSQGFKVKIQSYFFVAPCICQEYLKNPPLWRESFKAISISSALRQLKQVVFRVYKIFSFLQLRHILKISRLFLANLSQLFSLKFENIDFLKSFLMIASFLYGQFLHRIANCEWNNFFMAPCLYKKIRKIMKILSIEGNKANLIVNRNI